MKAIIVGGGISGLNTGLGLRRAGVDAKIYDRASNLASLQAGGGMHLWNNGMRALDYLGQRQRVEAAGEGVDAFTWYTDQGRLMGSGDVTELTRKLGIGATRHHPQGPAPDPRRGCRRRPDPVRLEVHRLRTGRRRRDGALRGRPRGAR